MVVCVGTDNRRVTFAVIILGKNFIQAHGLIFGVGWGVLLEDFLQMRFGGLYFGGAFFWGGGLSSLWYALSKVLS